MRLALIYPNTQKMVNYGVGCVASAAAAAGHEVRIYDTSYVPIREAAQAAAEYDVVGISAGTLQYRPATYAAALVKSVADVPVVLGGLHSTAVGGKILEQCPYVDYLCVGEGESFAADFLSAMDCGRNLRDVQNLVYRDGDRIASNPTRPPEDLDRLPKFRYDFWTAESVVQPFPLDGFCYVYSGRGCPYNCSYCANGCYLNLYGRRFIRRRMIPSVIEELKYLKSRYPVRFFYFGDEMLLNDLDYCEELFGRVQSDLGLPYGLMTRVEHVSPTAVELLHRTGCGYVGMGVECGDEEFRRRWLNRRMTDQQIVAAFRSLKSGAPRVELTAYFMTGWPVPYNDRLNSSTEQMIRSLAPKRWQRNVFHPFPGTRLYDYCKRNGLIDWDRYWAATAITGDIAKSVLRWDRVAQMDPDDVP